MPIRRKLSTRKPRRRVYRRRLPYRPRSMLRYNKVPSFVETFYQGTISTQNAGGVFSVQLGQLPQIASYQELYKQYRINWVKALIIPDYNSYQAQAGGPNVPRITYAVSDTVAPAAPASETSVLTDNGCRMRQLTRPVSITFRPVPYLSQQTIGGAGVAVNKRMQWINLTEPNVTHGGVMYWITGAGAQDMVARVYFKISFSLKDGN